MSDIRSRGWCFTLNNYSSEDESWAYSLSWESKYIVVGKEVGDSGTPHLQGFIYFDNKKSLMQMKDLHSSAHWERMRGTPSQAAEYCQKDGDYFQWGILPMSQDAKGQVEKERWEDYLDSAKSGKYDEIPAEVLVKYGKGLKQAVLLRSVYDKSDTESQMLWYYGPSASGKSRKAREENPGCYLKMCNKWWDDYVGQEVVLIEDFDIEHKCLAHHLKIWGDRYSFPAEVKGGKVDIRPRLIIVTSNYHPSDIWSRSEDLDPILRRFKPIKFGDVVYPLFVPTFNRIG